MQPESISTDTRRTQRSNSAPMAAGSGAAEDTGTPEAGGGGAGAGGRREPPPRNSDSPRNSAAKLRCGTVEEAAAFETDVVLDRMRAASGGRFSSAAVSTQMTAFGVLARELIARGHATPDGLVRAAGHAPHVPWICKLPGPLTVQRLCADDGRVLVELLTGSEGCLACGGNPLASGVFDAPAADSDDPGAAIRDAAWAEWERKMRAAGKEIPR